PRGIFCSPISRVATLAAVALLGWSVETLATPARSNVMCREELPSARREQLAAKLRRITGLQELKFGDDGLLREGNAQPVGGSSSARELVLNAIRGRKVVVIEDASNRADIAFAQVVPGRWKTSAVNRPPVFVVQIDFLDFERLVGDELALEAFNVGWGFLHELDHVINDSPDTDLLGEAGECEAHINQMRRESGLPERTDYLSTPLPAADNSFRPRLVRLAFEQKELAANKKKRYWVIWDANVVGGAERNQGVVALK